MTELTEEGREKAIRSKTKSNPNCYYCKLVDKQLFGMCWHHIQQSEVDVCFCSGSDGCYGGSLHSLCKMDNHMDSEGVPT